MKLTEDFKEILKAITLINSGSPVTGAVIKQGNIVKARRYKSKIPILVANLEEEIPQDFAILDLKKLLSISTMLDDAEVKFSENFFEIKGNKKKAKFRYATARLIEDPEWFDKEVKMPSETLFSFPLDKENFKVINNAAARLDSPQLAIISDGETVTISNYNIRDKESDRFSIDVGKSDKVFTIIIDISLINFLVKDYVVTLTKEGLIEFKSSDNKITYYITFSDKSTVE